MMSKTYRAPAKTELTARERYEAAEHARRRSARTERSRSEKTDFLTDITAFEHRLAPATLEAASMYLANV